MDGLREYHTNWSKSGRERQILYDITYTWNLKNNTDESIYKTKKTHGYEKHTYGLPNSWGRGGGINSEYWLNRYKLTYLK